MLKKYIKVFGVLILTGFSFYYTERVTRLIKDKDPIMIKINSVKDNSYISGIEPVINNDEYITGLNACEVDVEESYYQMKKYGEFNDELLVMKEVENNNSLKDKYIVGGNKYDKNIGLIFIVDDDLDNDLTYYIDEKGIRVNFFMSKDFLENNNMTVKFLSEKNNIYYLGNNGKYDDEYMLYMNNFIQMNSNNESKYCIVDEKNSNTLKLCSQYGMRTIKTTYLTDNILTDIKDNLTNGNIIAIKSDDIDKIKLSVNYIISRGYNLVSLDELLDQNNNCKIN